MKDQKFKAFVKKTLDVQWETVLYTEMFYLLDPVVEESDRFVSLKFLTALGLNDLTFKLNCSTGQGGSSLAV